MTNDSMWKKNLEGQTFRHSIELKFPLHESAAIRVTDLNSNAVTLPHLCFYYVNSKQNVLFSMCIMIVTCSSKKFKLFMQPHLAISTGIRLILPSLSSFMYNIYKVLNIFPKKKFFLLVIICIHHEWMNGWLDETRNAHHLQCALRLHS